MYLFCFRSLDTDQQNLDLKRQLQVVEQEANVLRTRNHKLETDNETLINENKHLLLTQTKKAIPGDKLAGLESQIRINKLEQDLEESKKKVCSFDNYVVIITIGYNIKES